MTDCETWEAATITRTWPYDQPEWTVTPIDTHISAEFADDPTARAFIESRYEIGEKCPRPFAPAAFHAHLRPTPDPAARSHRPDAQTAQIAEEADE